MKIRSVAFKLFAITAFIFILAYMSLILIMSSRIKENESVLRSSLNNYTREHALQVESDFNNKIQTAKTVRNAIVAAIETGSANRQMLDRLQLEVMRDNPSVSALWPIFQSNGFDGLDASFADQPGYDHTGRYLSMCVRNDKGDPILIFDDGYDEAPNDVRMKEEQRPFIPNPYYFNEVYYTSVVLPIKIRNEYLGLLGISIELDYLQEKYSTFSIFETGVASLLANNGVYVANSDSSKNGHIAADLTKSELAAIRNGQIIENKVEINGISWYQVIQPVWFDGMDSPWAFRLLVPDSDLIKQAVETRKTLIMVGVLSLLAVLLVSFTVTNHLINPLYAVIDNLDGLKDGFINLKLKSKRNDEVGQVIRSMMQFQKRLVEVTENIRNGYENILSESRKLGDTTQELATGAAEQASGYEEVSSSMEQMLASILHNNDNALSTGKISSQISQNVHEVSQSANESLQAIEQIAAYTKIITEIAEKTDLLAINASVEAARAGEYGRGFSIVADEVRKLSERSQKAAETISQKAVESLEKSQKANEMLQKILPDIQKTADLTREIATAGEEQQQNAQNVNQALLSLSQVTQTTASTADQLAENVAFFNKQAGLLEETINFFSFEKNHSPQKQQIIKNEMERLQKLIQELDQADTV